MNKEFCKAGMHVRVGFALKRVRLGNGKPVHYLEMGELTGVEGRVICADLEDGLAIIEDGCGRRYGVTVEELQQVLGRRAS